MKKISVIIPVFNAEQTIERCLNSIRNQTYGEIEILVVDDGSTDGSRKKIELLRQKDTRIKSFYLEQGGANA
ncbi:MAG: glycosyltransferase family 2 protein [Lachnospiraceae bacterium]|nr:glycosyltransferase family 2 protein [Lachnospiraceae bacterium]